MEADERVWDWRGYILKYAPENSTYRHVLLTLSCFMDSAGESCFPSVKRLVECTSLSKPTVLKYLEQAQKDGWIEISKIGLRGQKWRRQQYTATLPKKVVKEVDHVAKGGKADTEGGKTDTPKVVKEVNQYNNSPENSSSNSPNSVEPNGSPTQYDIPSHSEVEDYFRGQGTILEEDIPLEAKKFINHYEDEDWKTSKGKRIRNWHRQAGTWAANYQQFNRERLQGAQQESDGYEVYR